MAKTTRTSKTTTAPSIATERRSAKERRTDKDRRKVATPVAEERRTAVRDRRQARRRQIDPTTCERDYRTDEIEFMRAMDEYKRRSGRMFPTCSEILEVVRELGYEKRTPAAPVAETSDGPVKSAAAGEASVL